MSENNKHDAKTMREGRQARGVMGLVVFFISALCAAQSTMAQEGYGFAAPGSYGLKIYKVESGLYPFVQVYFRTFDSNMQPLVNLNAMNIGLMIRGRAYDPMKRQYTIQSIRQRKEATRTVLVMDASGSVKGAPFNAARRAAARYIDSKRPQDEVAILSIRDTDQGYELTSQFERDPGILGERLLDVRADGKKTRLYDTLGAAMQMCGMVSQGSISPGEGGAPVVSCSIVVFSDGRDEGSAISRNELNTRISGLTIPIPIYSLAYSKINKEYFKNLEAISKNSFGLYYGVGQSYDKMQRIVEGIQNIILGDYVVTFRAYDPPDGESYKLKLGVEYPSGSGKYTYQSTEFEAVELPPVGPIKALKEQFSQLIPKLTNGANPYYTSAESSTPSP